MSAAGIEFVSELVVFGLGEEWEYGTVKVVFFKDPGATEMEHWTVHDLRCSAATHMAAANVSPHVLSSLLGHSPGRTMGISAVYIRHRYLEERRQALEAWANHVLDLVKPTKRAKVG